MNIEFEIEIINMQEATCLVPHDYPGNKPEYRCMEKIIIQSSKNIFITSEELTLLRHCAEFIKDKPNHALRIVAKDCNNRLAFISKTLIHLGVSCGQIATNCR